MVGKMKTDSGKSCDKKNTCNYGKTKECSYKPLRIFCGKGSSAQFSISNATPGSIGFVSVDARELCKPLVKIKFSSIVSLASTGLDPEAQLTFTLFRVCDNEEPLELNSWTYESFQITSDSIIVGLDNSFSFIYCDRLNCSRLCEYFVEVSADNVSNAGVAVDNVQIQAIAQ